MSYGIKSNYCSVLLIYYYCWSDCFVFFVGGYYEGLDGFFCNLFNGKKVDNMEVGGGWIYVIWLFLENLKLDFIIGYDYNDEGGYFYYYIGVIDGYDKENEKYKNYIGKILYD